MDYDRLIKQGDSAVARFNRGIIHRRLGNSNRARVDFSQAVALGGSGNIANRARRYPAAGLIGGRGAFLHPALPGARRARTHR